MDIKPFLLIFKAQSSSQLLFRSKIWLGPPKVVASNAHAMTMTKTELNSHEFLKIGSRFGQMSPRSPPTVLMYKNYKDFGANSIFFSRLCVNQMQKNRYILFTKHTLLQNTLSIFSALSSQNTTNRNRGQIVKSWYNNKSHESKTNLAILQEFLIQISSLLFFLTV